MTVHVVELPGCSSQPLALYLKALGVLRMVAQQADADAMGMWKESSFVLISKLDRDALVRFFLERYRPTPLLDPWNGGSGFYAKDNKSGIEPLRASTAERFDPYRNAIGVADRLVGDAEAAPPKETKDAFIRRYTASCDDDGAEWVEAAIVLTGDGDPKYPALFGTGGNDGRLDFTNNFMQRLGSLFDMANPNGDATAVGASSLVPALFGEATPNVIEKNAIGQFFPSAAGGANAGNGASGDAAANPWDFVLMLEGGIALRASAVRRLADGVVRAAAPFAIHASPAGFASAVDVGEKDRGEQWLPIWTRPTRYAEVARLFGEGRSFVDGELARRPLDFARAIARQGVARGIDAFERFGYLERNGQANLATALGRWHVEPQPRQHLLDELAQWAERLGRAARDRVAPASIRRLSRQIEEHLLDCTRSPTESRVWIDLLVRCGEAERQLVSSLKFAHAQKLRPLPPLPAGILEAVDDGTTEARLAIGLASMTAAPRLERAASTLRSYWLPYERGRSFETNANGIVTTNRIVGRGRDLTEDLLRVLDRRIMELRQTKHRASLALTSRGQRYVGIDDVLAYVDGAVDDARVLALALPLMAVESFGGDRPRPPSRTRPTAPLALFRLVAPLETESRDRDVVLDARVVSALARGDARTASTLALARLSSLGHRPKVPRVVTSPARLRRLGAALLFPLAPWDVERCRAVITKPTQNLEEGTNE